MAEDLLILVDENDNPVGKMGKEEVHRRGLLHRAFSVFIFNTKGELLLQKRAEGKYHSGGLWTNTVCSHPRHGEELNDAVKRRLREEMGLDVTPKFAFSFTYRIEFENGLTEHEFDHVFIGVSDEKPQPDKEEVSEWKYEAPQKTLDDLKVYPMIYSAWFRICFPRVASTEFLPKP